MEKSLILLRKTKGVPGVPVTATQFLDISCPNYCQDPTTEVVCNPSHFDGGTQTYAAKWDREKVHFMVYPMSWDLANRNIPGVNRSTFYNTICGAC